MKCPKCGFNSFEYYDVCKKCSTDLTGYKQTYSITSMILPLEAKEKLAEEFRAAESDAGQADETPETHDDIFSFDLPEESTSAPVMGNDDPFNFDDQTPPFSSAAASTSEDDVFANLLESTSQAEESPFGAAAPAETKAPQATSGPGEFDLENFSWDEAPAAPGTEPATEPDDFDSLFGDAKENGSK